MKIKILDVRESDMRIAEHKFKDEVIVEDSEEGLFNLIFKDGCTLSTYADPINEVIVFNTNVNAVLVLRESDFSEVHII